jgi:nucleolar protein 58
MKAGSLINLAKYPASTIQILGAEKALFKAIRSKKNTPKYGLIYQTAIVGHAPTKLKGKISRGLAAKCALCIRCDALGESEDSQIGNDCKTYIEKRLAFLENAEEGGQKVEKPQRKPLQQSAPQGSG